MPNTFSVNTAYHVQDNASGGISGISKQLHYLTMNIMSLRSSLSGVGYLFGSIAGIATSSLGIRSLTESIIDFNAQMETMRIGIAGAFQNVTKTNWETSMGYAHAVYAEAQNVAALSVGTTKEVVGMYNSIVGSVLNVAGKTAGDAMDLVQNAISAAAAIGEPFEQAGLDMFRILAGHAGVEFVLFRNLLARGYINMDARQFNAMSQPDRLRVLTEALYKFTDAARAYADSLPGLTSTIQDIFEIGIGYFGRGIFEEIKKQLMQWRDVLLYDKAEIFSAFQALGTVIADTLKKKWDLNLYFKPLDAALDNLANYFNKLILILESILGFLATWYTGNAIIGLTKSIISGKFGVTGALSNIAFLSALEVLATNPTMANKLSNSFFGFLKNVGITDYSALSGLKSIGDLIGGLVLLTIIGVLDTLGWILYYVRMISDKIGGNTLAALTIGGIAAWKLRPALAWLFDFIVSLGTGAAAVAAAGGVASWLVPTAIAEGAAGVTAVAGVAGISWPVIAAVVVGLLLAGGLWWLGSWLSNQTQFQPTGPLDLNAFAEEREADFHELSENKRSILDKIMGGITSVNMNVENVNINQTFKTGDPDQVLLATREALAAMALSPLQATSGIDIRY